MSAVTDLIDVTIESVPPSPKPDESLPTLYDVTPKVYIGDRRTGEKDFTYYLMSINTALRTDAVRRRPPGTSPHETAPLDWNPVTIRTKQDESMPLDILLPADAPHIIEDVQDRVPILRSWMRLRNERLIINHLSSSTYFTLVTFDASNPLNQYESDAAPNVDIDDDLRTLAPYEVFDGWQLEAFMSKEVAKVLAKFPAYNEGVFDNTGKQGVNMAKFRSNFAEAHGLSAVHIFSGAYDSAAIGATASVGRLYDSLGLVICFVDRSRDGAVLREGRQRPMGPDGALALAISRDPTERSWEADDCEAAYMASVTADHVFSPRYEADALKLGIRYAQSDIFS